MKTPSIPSTAGDCVELVERGARFDLHQHANLVIRLGQIARNAAIAAGAGGDRDPADPLAADSAWTRPRAWPPRRSAHRKQQRLRADIERTLCQHRIVPGRPDDRRGRAALHGLQLRHEIGISFGECSMSSRIQSNPLSEIISAAMLLQRLDHSPICSLPSLQRALERDWSGIRP